MIYSYLFGLKNFGLNFNDCDEACFYDRAVKIYEQMGVAFDTTVNYRNVVGVRKQTPLTKENLHGIYDDYLWIFWISKNGTKHATQYTANTEPNYRYELRGTDGQDANQDGKLDIGRLSTGVYKYSTVMVSRDKLGLVFQLTESQRIERDINRNGYFDEEDEKMITKQSAMMEGRTMHIHKGGKTDTWSAGCQTLPPTAWQNFVKDISAGNKAGQMEFIYVLINE